MSKKYIFLIAASFLSICLATALGSVTVSPLNTISIISNKLFATPLLSSVSKSDIVIVLSLRLPRVLLAFLTGASLAVAGSVIQSVLKNPLASPFTLGVSSGASLAAGLVIISGITIPIIQKLTLPVAGFTGGVIAIFVSIALARSFDKNMSSNTIILTGMVMSLFINSILTLFSALNFDNIQRITLWQMGSFALKGYEYPLILLPFVIIGTFVLILFVKELDLLSFGEQQARAVGVNTKAVKWVLLSVSAIITGASVAFAGVIGFVDLISPHIVRKFFGARHIHLIPASFLFGGSFMVFCDLVARLIIKTAELPVGAVTAVFGAPFFIYVFFKKAKGE